MWEHFSTSFIRPKFLYVLASFPWNLDQFSTTFIISQSKLTEGFSLGWYPRRYNPPQIRNISASTRIKHFIAILEGESTYMKAKRISLVI